jgi:tetratricopeptide (TPR) repeat protein
MCPSNPRRKANRRGSRLLDEAWAALAKGNLVRGRRIALRALDTSPGNPMLWCEWGRMLRALECDAEAVEALQQALRLAPTMAEARQELAEIQGGADPAPPAPVESTPESVPPVPRVDPMLVQGLSRSLSGLCLEQASQGLLTTGLGPIRGLAAALPPRILGEPRPQCPGSDHAGLCRRAQGRCSRWAPGGPCGAVAGRDPCAAEGAL